ncbi:unnamed protein product [Timema podura]|uniref:Uncharacterized protein n=1 Tax=Timema podura TaxID=61482 RepID=A0ABN7NER7_TIMPD|nr:unnamed protein product [Timema podura]
MPSLPRKLRPGDREVCRENKNKVKYEQLVNTTETCTCGHYDKGVSLLLSGLTLTGRLESPSAGVGNLLHHVLVPVRFIRLSTNYASGLGNGKVEFRGSDSAFAWRENGKPLSKTTSSLPDRDSNLDIPVFDSLAQHEDSAFDSYATKAYPPRWRSWLTRQSCRARLPRTGRSRFTPPVMPTLATDLSRQFAGTLVSDSTEFEVKQSFYVMSDSEEDLELFLLLDSNYCLFEENTRTWIHDFNKYRSDSEFFKTSLSMRNYPDGYKDYHRMQIETFDYILEAIKEDLATHSNFRDGVSPEEKLTITISGFAPLFRVSLNLPLKLTYSLDSPSRVFVTERLLIQPEVRSTARRVTSFRPATLRASDNTHHYCWVETNPFDLTRLQSGIGRHRELSERADVPNGGGSYGTLQFVLSRA